MNSIINAAFSRTSAVLVGLLLLFVAGISSYYSIPKEAKPDIDILSLMSRLVMRVSHLKMPSAY